MAYYYCKESQFSEKLKQCGHFRKRNNGLCRSCLEFLDENGDGEGNVIWMTGQEPFVEVMMKDVVVERKEIHP